MKHYLMGAAWFIIFVIAFLAEADSVAGVAAVISATFTLIGHMD